MKAQARPKRRLATRPTLASRVRRVDDKTRRGAVKALRGKTTGPTDLRWRGPNPAGAAYRRDARASLCWARRAAPRNAPSSRGGRTGAGAGRASRASLFIAAKSAMSCEQMSFTSPSARRASSRKRA